MRGGARAGARAGAARRRARGARCRGCAQLHMISSVQEWGSSVGWVRRGVGVGGVCGEWVTTECAARV